jgi:ribulose-bisphosphate carboxylase large chain
LIDLIYACGGGILGHPMGVAAGVRSLQQAWEAAAQDVPLASYAVTRPELKSALELFGA